VESSRRFVGLGQPSPASSSPLSSALNRTGTRRRRTCRRPLFPRSVTPACTPVSSSSDVDDNVSPASTDVCLSAADSPWQGATVADDGDAEMTGDFSRPCSLPVVHGKHADLHSISPDTVTDRLLFSSNKFYVYTFSGAYLGGLPLPLWR